MPADLVPPAAAGAALLLGALLWRLAHLALLARRLRRALLDPSAARRTAAVEVATEQGLRRHAWALVDLVGRERDPRVRTALVDAVLRNAWEPADRRPVQWLRLWAHGERAARAAVAPTARAAAAVWTDPRPAPAPRHAAAAGPTSGPTSAPVPRPRSGARHRAPSAPPVVALGRGPAVEGER